MKHIILLMAIMMLVIGLQEREMTLSAPVMTGAVVLLGMWILLQDIHDTFKNKNKSNENNPH